VEHRDPQRVYLDLRPVPELVEPAAAAHLVEAEIPRPVVTIAIRACGAPDPNLVASAFARAYTTS
jgi:hypothetical protein